MGQYAQKERNVGKIFHRSDAVGQLISVAKRHGWSGGINHAVQWSSQSSGRQRAWDQDYAGRHGTAAGVRRRPTDFAAFRERPSVAQR